MPLSHHLRSATALSAALLLAALLAVSAPTAFATCRLEAEQPPAPGEAAAAVSAGQRGVGIPARAGTGRPNIVLIMTDDQTMSDLRWMPHVRRLVGGAGATFNRMISPNPLCCPARAEVLTGQQSQNSGVRSNKESRLGGFAALDTRQTIGRWLQRAGYRTAFVGKYLNGYHARDGRQRGWDVWNPTVRRVYSYFGFTMFDDGDRRRFKRQHNADVVSRYTTDYIERFAHGRRPFFIWASHVAPHGSCNPAAELNCWQPPKPAHRHRNLFRKATSPSLRDPAFNEADVSDKPGYIRRERPTKARQINTLFRQRIRSLQAVDDAVVDAVRALRRTGELDDTVFVFTSDNGYLLGEHRYKSKNVPYEQALRVPLLIRGPGIPGGVERDQAVTTVDLAATFLDVANGVAGVPLDGRSLLPLARSSDAPGYDTVLIQAGPRNRIERAAGWFFRGVRTQRYTYVRYPANGFAELYDRVADPAQLHNVAGDLRYAAVQAELAARTRALGDCVGAQCRQEFGPVPEPSSSPLP